MKAYILTSMYATDEPSMSVLGAYGTREKAEAALEQAIEDEREFVDDSYTMRRTGDYVTWYNGFGNGVEFIIVEREIE